MEQFHVQRTMKVCLIDSICGYEKSEKKKAQFRAEFTDQTFSACHVTLKYQYTRYNEGLFHTKHTNTERNKRYQVKNTHATVLTSSLATERRCSRTKYSQQFLNFVVAEERGGSNTRMKKSGQSGVPKFPLLSNKHSYYNDCFIWAIRLVEHAISTGDTRSEYTFFRKFQGLSALERRRYNIRGTMRGSYAVLVGKPDGKRPLEKPKRRWKGNSKMDLREVGWETWTGSIWLRTKTCGGLL